MFMFVPCTLSIYWLDPCEWILDEEMSSRRTAWLFYCTYFIFYFIFFHIFIVGYLSYSSFLTCFPLFSLVFLVSPLSVSLSLCVCVCLSVWAWHSIYSGCQSTCTPETHPPIKHLQYLYPSSSLQSLPDHSVLHVVTVLRPTPRLLEDSLVFCLNHDKLSVCLCSRSTVSQAFCLLRPNHLQSACPTNLLLTALFLPLFNKLVFWTLT